MIRYRGVPVIISDILINIIGSKNTRGMALGFFIVIRQPDKHDYVTSYMGRKWLMHLLEHEFTHIERQELLFRKNSRFKWFYKYLTDTDFKKTEEKIAIGREGKFDRNELIGYTLN